MTREEIVAELKRMTRGFYTHYPEGIKSPYNPDWTNASEIWYKINRLSSSLNDEHQTLYALQKELTEEGIKKG